MTNFEHKLKSLEDAYGVAILQAKITGCRWAYIGYSDKNIPISASKRIQFNNDSGVIVYNWNILEKEKQIELEKILLGLGGENNE